MRASSATNVAQWSSSWSIVLAWNFKAIDVVNAHVRRDADRMTAMAAGLALIESGKLDFGRLVTHRYPLSDIDRAFADLETKPTGFVKAVILPHG